MWSGPACFKNIKTKYLLSEKRGAWSDDVLRGDEVQEWMGEREQNSIEIQFRGAGGDGKT